MRITAPPLITMACHCKGCQRMSSSAYSLSVAVPSDGFAVIAGAPVIGGLHGPLQHYFCPYCMSWMFTKPPGMDWFVNVRASLLDDAEMFAPFIETCTKEKLSWATTPAVRSFASFPRLEEFPQLIEAYAKHLS
ncbi:MAG TPA: GFA family protein [Steroidobacteraceae bacterium]|nr:GFA family protein [Steroidobacteraceae bacterium]